jgi:thiamine kinase-like enzyme
MELKEEKEKLAEEIRKTFGQLGKNISCEQILASLQSAKKLGVTNTFVQVQIENENFLIRINGKLWPPYKRQDEENTLKMLRHFGIETNILYNAPDFQICRMPDENTKLENIIKSGNTENIMKATKLVAQEIAKYHKIERQSVEYPIHKMILDAEKVLQAKFKESPEQIEILNSFAEGCRKILKVLNSDIESNTFSQNDLLPSSLFVDLTNQKVSIVDWEYAGLTYWSNDLALLGRQLSPAQLDLLANLYHSAQVGSESVMPQEQKLHLQFNIFLHNFLNLAWRVMPSNINEYQEQITKMKEELASISNSLDVRYRHAMAPSGLFSQTTVSPYGRNKIKYEEIVKTPEAKV